MDGCSIISKPSLLPLNLIFIKTKQKKVLHQQQQQLSVIFESYFLHWTDVAGMLFFLHINFSSSGTPVECATNEFRFKMCFFLHFQRRWYDENTSIRTAIELAKELAQAYWIVCGHTNKYWSFSWLCFLCIAFSFVICTCTLWILVTINLHDWCLSAFPFAFIRIN